jgi:hypothetical protein
VVAAPASAGGALVKMLGEAVPLQPHGAREAGTAIAAASARRARMMMKSARSKKHARREIRSPHTDCHRFDMGARPALDIA